ncbi:hypothetical protein H4R20_006863, partial [Coemansia guatemalensis]
NLHLPLQLNRIGGLKFENSTAKASIVSGKGHYSTPHTNDQQLAEVTQAFESVRIARPTCNTCGGIEFEDTQAQRAHFKTTIHQENMSRKMEWRQNNADVQVGDSEYPWQPTKQEDLGDVERDAISEWSESDDSLIDEASDREAAPMPVARRRQESLELGGGEHSRYLWFTAGDSHIDQQPTDVVAYGIQRRVLVPKGTHDVHVDAGLLMQELKQMQLAPAAVKTQQELKKAKRAEIERQQMVSAVAAGVVKDGSAGSSSAAANLPETDPQSSLWTILSSDGGFFAAAVFENRSGEVVVHKTIQRYTTRRKQGGLQSRQDNAAGHAANSAG